MSLVDFGETLGEAPTRHIPPTKNAPLYFTSPRPYNLADAPGMRPVDRRKYNYLIRRATSGSRGGERGEGRDRKILGERFRCLDSGATSRTGWRCRISNAAPFRNALIRYIGETLSSVASCDLFCAFLSRRRRRREKCKTGLGDTTLSWTDNRKREDIWLETREDDWTEKRREGGGQRERKKARRNATEDVRKEGGLISIATKA